MWHHYRVEYAVEPISHIAWIGKVAVLVRYQGLVLTEIHFFTQSLYHLYRRIIERYISLTCFAFQLADFNLELGDVLKTVSDMDFLHSALKMYDTIFEINIAVYDSAQLPCPQPRVEHQKICRRLLIDRFAI